MADSQEKADVITSPEEEEGAAEATPVDGDSGPASLTTSKQLKEEEEKKAKKEKKDGLQNLKLGLLISGGVVVVVGAIFAVTKKNKAA